MNPHWLPWVRQHLTLLLQGQPGLQPEQLAAADRTLVEPGACFVTLSLHGQLRGCIGSLEPYRSLAIDLLENSVAAARHDPRFSPLTLAELAQVRIELSLLTQPQPLAYRDGADLMQQLQPGVHGVILSQGGRRATFLPQVWHQLPDPVDFLAHLCAKAGLSGDCWQHHPSILTYTVEKICEQEGDHG
ncbi:MAG: AmmeMemoRadiSam system protein A [Magnetococcales bacterium]|nr:AmmeMemoRadiSam system protein A [Magnetococcales bacterium]